MRHAIILVDDFNAQLGKEHKFRHIMRYYPANILANRNEEHLVGFCKAFNLVTAFKRLTRKQNTCTSLNSILGEFQTDHATI